MNIQVRVLSAAAQTQVAALQKQVAALQKQIAGGGAAASAFSSNLMGNERALTRWGNQIQWAGRQVQTNFTVPLLLAGGAAVKWSFDNEKAMTRVAKVYGDGTQSAQAMNNELKALDKSFVALSERFGVNQAAVKDVAAGWAAAGASGVALARATETTLRTMVLGDLDAVKATEALISIQAQYALSSKELSDVVAQLNIIENQTGISLAGLIDGYQRAAGVARSAGVDTRHLGAMLAALSPAAGSAAQAGNALKTIISRLLSPTGEAIKLLAEMGINIGDLNWKSLNATQRLQVMADKFDKLSDSQKAVVSATIASRYQINKFDVLMRALNDKTGFYQKALDATSDRTRYLRVAQQELNQVLNSSPQKMKIIWTMLQNAMTDIVQPLIPLILALANSIKEAVQWFSNLDPSLQKLLLGLGALLILVGPVVRYIGALATLTGFLGIAASGVGKLLSPVLTLARVLVTLPLSAALSGIVALGSGAVGAAKGVWALSFAVLGFIRSINFAAVLSSFAALSTNIIVIFKRIAVASTVLWVSLPGMFATGALKLVSAMSVLWISLPTIFANGILRIISAITVFWASLPAMFAAGALKVVAVWKKMLYEIQVIMLVGVSGLGVIWRNGLAAITAATAGFRTIILLIWTSLAGGLKSLGPIILRAFSSPWTIAILAALGIIYQFRDKIGEIWTNIVQFTQKAFDALPESIANALTATVRIIAAAAKQIYEWFSYINPFAHHSPSLVEEVTRGMKVIGEQFGTLKTTSNPIILLKNRLAALKAELREQQQVVLNWKNALAAANSTLDVAKKKLDLLKDAASKIGDALNAAKDRMEQFASTPIQGMQEMSDQIFETEQAQKALQLQMMKMEDAVGPLDKLESKMSGINGQIELMRGQQAELRSAGAGSDILAAFDTQIAGLQNQKGGLQGQIEALQNLRDEIDKLDRKAQELDLEKSLKFDALLREIDQIAHSMKELPFDQILAGVKANRAEVDRLQAAYNAATAAVDNQQKVVDAAQAARDKLQAVYDAERRKLDQMTLSYNKLHDAMVGANGAAADSPAVAAFKAGAGGNFPDVAGSGSQLGRDFPGVEDQSSLIDQFTKDMAKQTSDMFGQFDMFKPIRDGWNNTVAWLRGHIGPAMASLKGAFSGAGTSAGGVISGIEDQLKPFITTISDIGHTIWEGLGSIWRLIGPEVKKTLKAIGGFLGDLIKHVGPQVVKFAKLFGPLMEAIGHVWNVAKPFITLLAVGLLGALKVIWSMINGAVVPMFKTFAKVLGNVVQIVYNVVKLVLDIINGDWKKAWQDAQQIVAGVFAAIGNLIKGAWNVIVGIVKGFVTGIINFFKWLWDELVGHSIIPDMIMSIISWFVRLPLEILKAIGRLVKDIATWAWNAMTSAWNSFKNGWSSIIRWLKSLPGLAVQALSSLGSMLANVAKTAFQSFWNGAKAIFDGAKGFIGWLAGIPGRAAAALAKMGSVVADAIKGAWNGAAGWINKWIIGNINKVTGLFGLHIPGLPTFAKGGVVPGDPRGVIPGAVSQKDNVLIAARTGEGILVPEAVRGLGGAKGIQTLNRMFMRNQSTRAFDAMQQGGRKGNSLQHFHSGGVVGAAEDIGSWIKNHFEDWMKRGAGFVLDNILKPVGGAIKMIMPDGFMEDWLVGVVNQWRGAVQQWGHDTDVKYGTAITAGLGLGRVQEAQSFVKSQEGKPYVWGATGPGSYDCSGLASAVFGILTGRGGGHGQRYFTTATIGAGQGFHKGTGAFTIGDDRGSHMAGSLMGLKFEATPPRVLVGNAAKTVTSFPEQWTLDRGGLLPPGLTSIMNGTGKPEAVLTHTQWSAIMGAERAFASFTSSVLKGGPGSILAAANARARAGSDRASATAQSQGSRDHMTVHIHGDLSFPNIDNHSSARDFLDNLENVARS